MIEDLNPANETLTAFIVDDEASARNNFLRLIEDFCPEVKVVGTSGVPTEALDQINSLRPHLVFLDVEMPELNGLQMAEFIPQEQSLVVFVTAHNRYAVDAFKRNAVDYLLKPAKIQELKDTIERVRHRLRMSDRDERIQQVMRELREHQQFDKMLLPFSQGFVTAALEDIIRIESDNAYSTVYTTKQKVVVSKSIGEFERLLTDRPFYRVHNSHIIHLKYLESYNNTDGGVAIMTDGQRIPISRRKLAWFKDVVKEHYQHF